MNVFTLLRVAILREGAFGVLLQDGVPFAVTLERTYATFGEAGISERYETLAGPQFVKVPHGRLRCTRTTFHRGGYATFEIHAPGHSRIVFHRGNLEAHSEGCCLVAESYGQLKGEPAVLDSAGGFAELMTRADELAEFWLDVRAAA